LSGSPKEIPILKASARKLSASSTDAAAIQECWACLDGAHMRYLRAGSGPPLVLLHGLMGYSFSWRFTMPALAPYATVYAPDMLGAGFSERAQGIDHGLQATALRVLQLVQQLGIWSFDLLGTSHGGGVAIMAAAESLRRPDLPKINRLILSAPINPYSAHGRRLAPFIGSRVGSALFRFVMPHSLFLYSFFHARMFGDRRNMPADSGPGYLKPMAIPGLFDHGLGIVSTWTADLRKLEAVLPEVGRIPTLFIWGSKDSAVFLSSAKPLAQYFPNSRLVVFPGVGHLPYEECPDDFNRALIEFLTNTPGALSGNGGLTVGPRG